MDIATHQLEALVERTFDMHRARAEYLQNVEPYPDLRFELAFDSSLLSLEHSEAACLLLHEGLEGSAISIMRTQFETLVRGMWFAYVATEQWIQKFATPLTERTARRADAAPMLKEMLDALQTSSAAPKPIIDQLCEYRDVTWKALNSYTHGGFHPMSRAMTGYPPGFLFNVLRNSNAVSALAAQLACVMSGDESHRDFIRWLHREFEDCLPIISGPIEVVS